MLVLTRRPGESITIGDRIVLTVLGIKGNGVRVGVNVPKNVSVHREEIDKRISVELERRTDDSHGDEDLEDLPEDKADRQGKREPRYWLR